MNIHTSNLFARIKTIISNPVWMSLHWFILIVCIAKVPALFPMLFGFLGTWYYAYNAILNFPEESEQSI
jgi:hypothetical protein